MLRDFPSLEKEIRPLASAFVNWAVVIPGAFLITPVIIYLFLVAFWKSYRRENTPEILEELSTKKEGSRYLSEEERNERLIRLYKQNFERHHPGSLSMKLQELVPNSKAKVGTTAATAVPTTTHRSMVVPLKEVLKESKAADDAEEDSDEDQVGRRNLGGEGWSD